MTDSQKSIPNINMIVVGGNLTADAELRTLDSGTNVLKGRLACNTATKVNGEWTTKVNYFSFTVWGAYAAAIADRLVKGTPVHVSGRMEWSEWEKDGVKRQSYDLIADQVDIGRRNGGTNGSSAKPAASNTEAPAAEAEEEQTTASGKAIPF